MCKLVKDSERFDCYPEDGANQKDCETRGCCWLPAETGTKFGVPLDVPYCFYPSNYNGYSFVNITKEAFGIEALLQRTYRSPYPDDVKILKMVFRFETMERLRVKVISCSTALLDNIFIDYKWLRLWDILISKALMRM